MASPCQGRQRRIGRFGGLPAGEPISDPSLEPVHKCTAGGLQNVAPRNDATPAQVAMAWLLRRPGVVVIPKAARGTHVDANRAALDLQLTADDLTELDAAFPPPVAATPLEMR